jgi:hypothetical protein
MWEWRGRVWSDCEGVESVWGLCSVWGVRVCKGEIVPVREYVSVFDSIHVRGVYGVVCGGK